MYFSIKYDSCKVAVLSLCAFKLGTFLLFANQHPVTILQVPNFLHLTPAAIKKHCEALKRTSFISLSVILSVAMNIFVHYCIIVIVLREH